MSIKRIITYITVLTMVALSFCLVSTASAKPDALVGETVCYGTTITGNYTYTGTVPQGDSIFRWYASDDFFGEGTLIEGENQLTLNVDNSTLGKFLTFAVVPVDKNGVEGKEVRAEPIMQNNGYYEDFSGDNTDNIKTVTTSGDEAAITSDPLGGDDNVFSVNKQAKSSFKTEGRIYFDDVTSSESIIDVYLYASDISGTARLFGVYDDIYGSVIELQTNKDGELFYRTADGLIKSEQSFPMEKWNHVVISIDGDNKTVKAEIDGQSIINGDGTDSWRFENEGYNNVASYFTNYGNGGTICIKNLAVMNLDGDEIANEDALWLEEQLPQSTEADITLPTRGENNSYIYWKSDKPEYISDTGVVTRPKNGLGNARVGLTAYVVNGSSIVKKQFVVTVIEATVAPVAKDITITQNGTRPLFATYTYYDYENYEQQGSEFQWYAEQDGTYKAIEGANDLIFSPGAEYDGKNIRFSVIPRNEANVKGEETFSEPFRYTYFETQKPVGKIISQKINTDGAFEFEYTYNSADYIKEGNTQIRWLVSDTLFGEYRVIEGANGLTYTPEDNTKYYKFSLIPVDAEGNNGEEIVTDAFMYSVGISNTKSVVESAIKEVVVPKTTNTDIELPLVSTEGAVYTWVSSDQAYLSADGKISRPDKLSEDATVTLTVYAVSGFNTASKEYTITIQKYSSAPVISNYKLSQTNRPINIEYEYSDEDEDEETGTVYEWYYKSDADGELTLIEDANGKMYAPAQSMDGYIFVAKITPIDATKTKGETYTTAEYTYVYQSPAKPEAFIEKTKYNGLYLTGNYTYSNIDGIPEGDSLYGWYVSDTLLGEYKQIEGENSVNFAPSLDYDGKYFKFSVKPEDEEGICGETVFSDPAYVKYAQPETFDDKNVISNRVNTSNLVSGTVAVVDDPSGGNNNVLMLNRTSKVNPELSKIAYAVPDHTGATGLVIEADVYPSSDLSGVWEMFYICDSSMNTHAYKLWFSNNRLYTRGGSIVVDGVTVSDSSSVVSNKFTKDTWHTIRVVLDYQKQMMLEARFDGEVVQTDMPFRYKVAHVNYIASYIQNQYTGTGYMDNLRFTPIYNTDNKAKADAEAIDFGTDLDALISNIRLPKEGTENGSTIVWESSDESVINLRGKVTRPASADGDKKVTLTAHVINENDYYKREFDITVMRILLPDEAVEYDKAKLDVYDGMIISDSIMLPQKGGNGSNIAWESSDKSAIDNFGNVTKSNVKKDVVFDVTISNGDSKQTKKIVITLAPEYGDNLIVNGGMAASSSKAKYPAVYAIDNDYNTTWKNLDSDSLPYIIMDMGKAKNVNRLYIADASKTVKSVILSSSTDKSHWNDVSITKNISGENISFVEFDELNTRYIRAQLVCDNSVEINEIALLYVQPDEDKVINGIDDIKLNITGPVTSDFDVVTELSGGVKVQWTSSDTSAISFSGSKAIVTRTTYDKSVTVTATVTSGGVSEQRSFVIVVKGTSSYTPMGGGGSGSGGGSGGASSAVGAIAPTVTPQTQYSKFEDVISVPWAIDAINKLNSIGVVNGTSATTFEPSRSITREEFAAILYRGFGFDKVSTDGSFADVKPNDWYFEPVMQLNSMGIIAGKGDGSFGTGETITRQDMAVMIYRAAQKADAVFNKQGMAFSDDTSISNYAKTAVNALSGEGIINGVGNGMFNPLGNATRAEATVILSRIMDYIN